jgi:hypothetical protein
MIWSALQFMALLSISISSDALCAETHQGIEVKPFGLLNTDASLSIRYFLDENDRSSASSAPSFEHRSTWEQELFLVSRSYVYHPGFLNMEFGGGPLLVQQSFDSNFGSESADESLFNILARLNFLELKSYPFSLYYRRTHPSMTTSLSGRFLTRNNEYGFSGRKRFVDQAAGVTLELSHRDTEGSGFDTVVDEDEDRSIIGFSKSYRENDKISFEHNRYKRDSSSGSVGLPIQESMIEEDRSHIAAQNSFGSRKQFSLNQSIVRLEQDRQSTVSSHQEDLNYSAAGRWQNSEAVRSSFGYRFNESKRVGADTKSHNANAGLVHSVSDAFQYDILANHEDVRQTGFKSLRSGVRGGAIYSHSTDLGSFSLSGSLGQQRTDQESESDSIQVFDEPLTLIGTTSVELANEFVIASSVVVTNTAGTQVFVEDDDYRLIVIGSVTSIQRLIDGNIFDGQTVLVDYQYQTSGTAKFDTFDGNLGVSFSFPKYVSARLRYSLRDSTLISGELTTPLNDRELLEATLAADFPIGHRWQLGAEIRHLDQDEEIAPFVRDSISLRASTRIFGSMRMDFSASRIEVDQKESIEDVDQLNYRFGISGNAFARINLAYQFSFLEDTGGSLPREQLRHRFSLAGRYRQIRYVLQAVVSEDMLGDTERDYTRFSAIITRAF